MSGFGGYMIGDREQVYENIKTAVSLNQLNSKVEPGDPKLLREDKEALLRHILIIGQHMVFA